MNRLLLLLPLCVLAVSQKLIAQDNWVKLTESSTGAIWFVEAFSIRDVQEGYPVRTVRKAWIKIDYSAVRSEPARESKVLFFFDCVQEQAKSTTWVDYRADGTVLRDMSAGYSTYSPVIPDTVSAGAMHLICGVDLDVIRPTNP